MTYVYRCTHSEREGMPISNMKIIEEVKSLIKQLNTSLKMDKLGDPLLQHMLQSVLQMWRNSTDRHDKSRKENPQKLTQLSSRSHPRHLVGKRTAQKDITIDTTSDSQINSNI